MLVLVLLVVAVVAIAGGPLWAALLAIVVGGLASGYARNADNRRGGQR